MTIRRGKTQARRTGGFKYLLTLLAGLVLGLVVAAAYLVFVDRQPLDAILPEPDSAAKAPAIEHGREALAQEPAAAPAEAPRPRFDFYTVLPAREVELPQVAAPTDPTEIGAAAPAPKPTGNVTALQVGAFTSAEDAEAMRARLAMLGLVARIETVRTAERTLHRVRLGPFTDAAALDAARARLADAGLTATPAH